MKYLTGITLLLHTVLTGILSAQQDVNPFEATRTPPLFDQLVLASLESDDQSDLRNFLESVVSNSQISNTAREKAAFISKRLGIPPQSSSPLASSGRPVEELSNRTSFFASKLISSQVIGAKSLQAHLLDLAIDLNRENVASAYALEVLKVKSKVALEWDLEPVSDGKVEEAVWTTVMLGTPSDPFAPDGSSIVLRTQSHIIGLMVRQLGDSKFAGAASRMNATVAFQPSQEEWEVSFNQSVGSMMSGALVRVKKFLEKRYDKVPSGFNVELSFEDQYIPKDGPSAAVACCLLLDGLLGNNEYDPNLAVTGDMTESGKVGEVGGIDGKIRGATAKKCSIVAIPAVNQSVVSDLLLTEGPAPLAKIQIFQLATFDEALDLARVDEQRRPELKEAIDLFSQVQAVLNQPKGLNYLRNSAIQEKLRKVVSLAPNHLSARYLYLQAINKEPNKLSLTGSLQAITRARAPLNRALRDKKFDPRVSELNKDEFGDTVSLLTRLRSKLDSRTISSADALTEFTALLRQWRENRPNTRGKQLELIEKIGLAENRVSDEFDRLFSRPDVKEELKLDDEDLENEKLEEEDLD